MPRALLLPLALLLGSGVSAGPLGPTELAALVSQSTIEQHVAALVAFDRWTPAGKQATRDYVSAAFSLWGYAPTTDAAGNVRAERMGTTTPDRVFVIGGHFDTVENSPGADDDASGVAGMLEIARIFSFTDPASSILFVAFDEEEIGLRGSFALAAELAGAGTDVIGMISMDMIAYTAGPGEQFPIPPIPGCLDVSTEDNTQPADFIGVLGNDQGQIDRFASAATTHVPELRHEWARALDGNGLCFSDLRRSDHVGFWDEGWNAILLTDTGNFRNPFYHTPDDTPDNVDFVFARNVAGAATAFLVEELQAVPEPTALWLYAVGAAVLAPARARAMRGSASTRASASRR